MIMLSIFFCLKSIDSLKNMLTLNDFEYIMLLKYGKTK